MGNKSVYSRILLFFVPALLLVGLLMLHAHVTQAAALHSTTSGEMLGGTARVASTLTATLQIHSPKNGAYITAQEGSLLTIEGYAWNTYDPPPFPDVPVLEPIDNFEGGGSYNVSWSAVPTGDNYELEEADNPQFDSPTTYATSNTSEFIAGKPVGTYYYRVRAYNDAGRRSRFSNVESVTVTSASLAGFSLFSRTSALPEGPKVENTVLATGTLTVQVQIDGGSWVTATVVDEGEWWSWSYDWSLPQADEVEYPIRARARVDSGEWSDLDTITVTVDNNIFLTYFPLIFKWWPPVPYPPTLSEINNADADGDYTVSWTYGTYTGVPAPTSFTIQEATNANFTNPTEYSVTGSARSRSFTGKSNGTYYYRVRGVNSYGNGPWSNVRSVVVSIGFYDNFSNANSGWPHQQTYSHDGTAYLYADYYNGTYRMKVLRDDTGENNKKMAIIKAPYTKSHTNYDVYVEHFFTRAGDAAVEPAQGKASLIFAANDSFSTIYAVEWNYEGHCAVNKYTDVSVPVSAYENSDLDHHPLKGWGECGAYGVRGGYDKVNRFRVEVRNTTARIYAYDKDGGRHLVYQFSDGALSSHRRTGLVTGSWEWTPVESRFDNYRVEPK